MPAPEEPSHGNTDPNAQAPTKVCAESQGKSKAPPRQRNELKTAQDLEFARVILDSVEDAIITVDLDGIITTWNAAAQRLFGHPRAEALGNPLLTLTLPSALVEASARIQHVKSSGIVETFETVRVQKNGDEMCLSLTLSPIRNETEKMIGISIVARDVTAQKVSEDEHRQSAERLRMIIETAREYAIFSLDLERRITSWNSGASALLGYSHQEVLNLSGDIIFTPEDRVAEAPQREASIALAHGRAADERWHLRKDGTRFWGSGVMMRMRDAKGAPVGLVKVFRDQTQEEKAKASLTESLLQTEQARLQAEEAVRMKERLLAVISHELRTPLTPIVMAVESLFRSPNLSDAQHQSLQMIKRNVELEAKFVDDLLDITRISNGKLDHVAEPLDVHEVLKHALEVTGPDIEARNQTVTLSLEAKDHQLSGDSRRLQQVFWNLLKNASKFTPEGGTLHVCTQSSEGRIVIAFIDSGIGFEKKLCEQIFEPFDQGQPTVPRHFGGLGLGLTISRAAVMAHGGKINAHSEGPGKGATFSVELPLFSAP